jgi:trigger factor
MSADTMELKIAVQETESWSRRLSITVPAARVRRARGAVAKQFARNVRLPGFRQGKLPERVVEQKFGPSIDQETIDRMIQEAYREALDAQGLTPITQGKVDNVEYARDADLRFEVEFEVQPTVEIQRVSGFTVSRPGSEVGEEDVDAVLERLREERATWEPLQEGTRPGYGDQVVVEIRVLDGASAEEEPRTYRFVLGEGQAIPAVEEAILTLRVGEQGEFTVTFPEDFPDESRRGQEQRLQIQLTEAQSKVHAELDDAFAASVGEFESVAALRERILTDLREDARNRAEAEVRRQLVDQIIEANAFEVPDSMIDRYLEYMTGGGQQGQEKPKERTPEEEEQFAKVREALRPQATWGLKRMMIVDRLVAREGLAATQDEIDERVGRLAEQHGRTPSEVWIQLEKSGQLEVLEKEISEEKVFRFLLDQNTVV